MLFLSMALTKCVAMVAVVLLSCSVDAAEKTDCGALKSCLEKISVDKPECRCTDQMKDLYNEFNGCLKQKKVLDRCEGNRANYVCYRGNIPDCEDKAGICFRTYQNALTAAEETAFNACGNAIKKKALKVLGSG